MTMRPACEDVTAAAVSLATTTVGVGAAVLLVRGVDADSPWSVLAAGVVVALGELLLAPLLRVLARFGGAGGAFLAGLGAQVLVTWAALTWVPGLDVASGWAVLWVLVVTALVMAVGRWVWAGPGNRYVVDGVLRRARRAARRQGRGPEDAGRPPGLLVVVLDGVGAAVLEQAVDAGLVPTMQRWLDDGTHTLERWWARLPATTPASQAGLLHGDSARIPSFRWWDRDLGRLVVTNRPADAALVEERLGAQDGLLAGGVAVQLMFSGGAATSFLVMSRSRQRAAGGLGPGQGYLRFFAQPFVVVRALTVTVGEMLKEVYQAHRQRTHQVRPRIGRGGWYVLLRGVTNVLMRDLSTSIVAGQLARGEPVVAVDFVDYDEIAHHAGPTRPESLRALEGLDGVLGTLEQVLPWTPRAYEVVVLSDHGQTLGATYEQVAGEPLVDTVRRLMAQPDADALDSSGGEEFGPLNALLNSVLGPPTARTGRAREQRRDADAHAGGEPPEVVVAASGNLGTIWFPRMARRPTLEEVRVAYPGLVSGLVATPGIGVVVAATDDRGPVAVGADGVVLLASGEIGGLDPLAVYGPRAREDLLRAATLPEAADLVVISAVTAAGHVHAFENQVGSHGGLGGEQSWPFWLRPAGWAVDDDAREDVGGRRVLVGAEAVHARLVARLAELGLRGERVRP
jgi:hypothetical protein